MRYLKVLGVAIAITALSACGSNGDTTTTSKPTTTKEVTTAAEAITETTTKKTETTTEAPKVKTRDNSSAVETTLFSGTFDVGEDIPAGRYEISGDGSGNLFVYDKNNLPIINEILESGTSGFSLGVPTVTVSLEAGHKIEIIGINNVFLKPADTVSNTTLTTGTWVVGLDIPAGSYVATCLDGESGNLIIYGKGIMPVVNEILSKDSSGFGVEKVKVKLSDGDVITISSLTSVMFE